MQPPNNPVPEKDEIDTCLQYLRKEIQIISPAIVCICWSNCFTSLLNLKNLQNYHGKIITYDNIRYFITYHPAATIYNNNLRELFFNEISLVVNMVKTKLSVFSYFDGFKQTFSIYKTIVKKYTWQ